MNTNPTQQSAPARYRRYSNDEPEAKLELARVKDALTELYELLEDYAPTWYTEQHHKKAASALRLTKKL